jgi:histidinol phosphatase-like PHP family hydrolase
MSNQPCFIGMQAEGREWPTLFSAESVAKFDYVFTDAMTIVDHRGRRARLWMPEEVDIPDKQAFMELLVQTIESILDREPVDIYANPTYLPDMLIKEYDLLWTPERIQRVIDAAARNGVAIEISNRLKLPKADFIRRAKKAGIKFTIGTNNVDSNLGREEYALEMIRQCDLQPGDMFLPKPDGKKPIQVRGFQGK